MSISSLSRSLTRRREDKFSNPIIFFKYEKEGAQRLLVTIIANNTT
jgi:hypothetical protein